MEGKALHEILKEQLDLKGLTIDRLSSATGIPGRYIEGLIAGDLTKLPSAPYVRGYLTKIAPLLDLSIEELWEVYKKEQGLKRSGPDDKLPSNRFAIKPFNKKIVVASFFAILLIAYLGWNASHLLGRPKLDIINPLAQTVIVTEPVIKLLGYVNPADKLLINNKEVVVNQNGLFRKQYNLQIGLNAIEFSVKRFLGKETTAVKQVI